MASPTCHEDSSRQMMHDFHVNSPRLDKILVKLFRK
jgi:hypothetical protein